VVDIKYIAMVNLIMDKPVVTELIQNNLNTENLVSELKKCLSLHRETQIADYKLLKQKLGDANASLRAAKSILEFLNLNEI